MVLTHVHDHAARRRSYALVAEALCAGYSPDPRVIGSTCGAGDFPAVASKCIIDRVMAAPPLRVTENDARFDARTREGRTTSEKRLSSATGSP
jgi:hypothetical protein